MKEVTITQPTNEMLAERILETWKISREINKCVGNNLSEDYAENQHNIAHSELLETLKALKEKDMTEVLDGICDLNVTVSECVMIQDEAEWLLKDLPKYLNDDTLSVEQCIDLASEAFHRKVGASNSIVSNYDYSTALDYIVDATVTVNGNIYDYLQAVNFSNISKFPEVEDVDPEVECSYIEDQGRYTDVYFEEGELLGKQVYIFKSKYDSENDEHFPKGKYLKPSVFKEPQEYL